MKIRTTITEIECSANELRQSNTLSDGIYNALRGCFNNLASDCDTDAEEEQTESEQLQEE